MRYTHVALHLALATLLCQGPLSQGNKAYAATSITTEKAPIFIDWKDFDLTIEDLEKIVDTLEQRIDYLSLRKNPDREESENLRQLVVQLAFLGSLNASTQEVDELNRDVIELFDQSDESFEQYAHLLKTPTGSFSTKNFSYQDHINLSGSVWKRIKRVFHKGEKFVRKHKKEVFTGLAILVGVGAAAVKIQQASKAKKAPRGETTDTTKSPEQLAEQPDDIFSDYVTPFFFANKEKAASEKVFQEVQGRSLFQMILEKGEKRAKEERYPELVYSQMELEAAKIRISNEWNGFKESVVQEISKNWRETTLKATEFFLNMKDCLRGSSVEQIFAVVMMAKKTAELVCEQTENIENWYKPAVEACRELQQMEEANRIASCSQCETENYKPNLQFHTNPTHADENRSSFVDLNNPNPHEIIMVIP